MTAVSAKRSLELVIDLPQGVSPTAYAYGDGTPRIELQVPQGEWGYTASALREAADELDENWR
ncbi:MAG: hypothetical protein OXG44_07375 [Gammaproteobacteria bacterium]|nr:hypothetical protein [Gammaproteobacteria bacterium]